MTPIEADQLLAFALNRITLESNQAFQKCMANGPVRTCSATLPSGAKHKVEILSRCKGCAMGPEKLIDLLLSELTSTPAALLASSAQSLQA